MSATQAQLTEALKLVAPVCANLSLAAECKQLKRSTVVGAIDALRKAIAVLEKI